MADWIKMRSGLLTNPKVIRMSRLLAESRTFINWWLRGTNKVTCDVTVYEICDVTVVTRVTVASLLSVWSAVNDASQTDGFVAGISLLDVDEMAGVHGFGEAMQTVGWLQISDDGILFPNFSEHNTVGKARQVKGSSSAKTPAERTRAWRDRKRQLELDVTGDATTSRDVTVTSQRDDREEKNREDIKPSTSNVTSDAFDSFWSAYPKKVAKDTAKRSFAKLKPDAALLDRMLAAVAAAKLSDQWRKDGGQFVPNPTTWLNQRRWEDETTGHAPTNGVDRYEAIDPVQAAWMRGAI
ncbi:conserved protein of unknown function [Pararobbsia alpina]|uniref:hypothetical protein n=1 Tax=Pararobbsia alpina TaxID=621374 RepID=UPI0039A75B5E